MHADEKGSGGSDEATVAASPTSTAWRAAIAAGRIPMDLEREEAEEIASELRAADLQHIQPQPSSAPDDGPGR